MAEFGTLSLSRLSTCHTKLVELCNAVVSWFDITVLCGHRGKVEQHAAFINGYSKKDWPDSLHNTLLSLAVDITPYPVDLNDRSRHILMGGVMLAEARRLGIPIIWGGDWNADFQFNQRFEDMYHIELNLRELGLDPADFRPPGDEI